MTHKNNQVIVKSEWCKLLLIIVAIILTTILLFPYVGCNNLNPYIWLIPQLFIALILSMPIIIVVLIPKYKLLAFFSFAIASIIATIIFFGKPLLILLQFLTKNIPNAYPFELYGAYNGCTGLGGIISIFTIPMSLIIILMISFGLYKLSLNNMLRVLIIIVSIIVIFLLVFIRHEDYRHNLYRTEFEKMGIRTSHQCEQISDKDLLIECLKWCDQEITRYIEGKSYQCQVEKNKSLCDNIFWKGSNNYETCLIYVTEKSNADNCLLIRDIRRKINCAINVDPQSSGGGEYPNHDIEYYIYALYIRQGYHDLSPISDDCQKIYNQTIREQCQKDYSKAIKLFS